MSWIVDLAAFPPSLLAPMVVALVLPVALLAGWFARHRQRPPTVASRVALMAGTVVSTAIGLGIAATTVAVVEAGLDASFPETRDLALDLAAATERAWPDRAADPGPLKPLLTVAGSARSQVLWLAIVRLDCSVACVVASAGAPPPALAERLGLTIANGPEGRSARSLRFGPHLAATARAAVRTREGRPHAVAIAATDLSAVSRRARRSAWGLVVAEIFLAGLAWLTVRRLLVITVADRLNRLVDRLGGGLPPGQPGTRPPGDELETLADQVEASLRHSAALEGELERGRRIEALGRLSGGIAHDFNNLLTVIRGNVSLLRWHRASEEVDAIDEAARRGAVLVRKLLAFGRSDTLTVRPEPIGALLHEALALVRRVLPSSVEVAVRCEVPDAWMSVDRGAFEQIVLNLATNARDAMPGGGRFEVQADVGPLPPAAATQLAVGGHRRFVVVRFRDDGVGMESEALRRVFEPFFTTKSPDYGSGLGLAIVHGLTRRQGGWVEIESRPGGGTSATIYFAEAAPTPASEGAVPLPAHRRPPIAVRRLLLVDDEEEVRRTTARALSRLDYLVDVAANGQEAEALVTADAAYDVIVSDVTMPVTNGLDFTRAIRAKGIDTPVLLVTGYSVDDIAAFCRAHRNVRAVGKPWSLAQLGDALDELIDASQGNRGTVATAEKSFEGPNAG